MMQGGPNGRRPRGRHHGGGGGRNHGGGGHDRSNGNTVGNPNLNNNRPRSAASLRHQTFDSNCIDVRVRGNAWQVHEKYQALARDAQSSGDRVAAEHYLQHAEHYYRIIEAINEATAAEQPQQRPASPSAPYGQQPDVPPNYYGGNAVSGGHGVQPPAGDAANGMSQQTQPMPQQQGQAEVQHRVQPQAQAPFFQPEESEEQDGPQPLVARR